MMSSIAVDSLQELDRAYQLHPFTNHQDMHQTGTRVIRSGKGCQLVGESGETLLDGLAGLWCVQVGYGRKEIIDAVAKQMEKLSYYPSFFNTTTESAIMLSETLARLAPDRLNHTMYCNSGSEANETALKLIRGYNKLKGRPNKNKIITRNYAYHGVTLATTSMTGLPSCQEPFNLPLPGFLHAPGPHAYAAGRSADPVEYGKECVRETQKLIEREGPETIAALVAEPIQGAGGVIVPPEGYMMALRALCREYDILFVADEVITGFGRVGDWFASNMWDLDPDMMCLAKGLTSGYIPLGATMVSDEMAEVLIKGGYLAHGFTYSGHPVSCACAMANLGILEKEKLPERVATDIGPYFQQKMAQFRSHPLVGEVRGLGLIGAIELKPAAIGAAANTLGVKVAAYVREEGAIVRGIRDIVAFAPPLVISHAEVDFLFEAVEKGLSRLE